MPAVGIRQPSQMLDRNLVKDQVRKHGHELLSTVE